MEEDLLVQRMLLTHALLYLSQYSQPVRFSWSIVEVYEDVAEEYCLLKLCALSGSEY